MKKISRRAVAALLLAVILCAGLTGFLLRWKREGETWALFSGNPHVYRSGRLALGAVTAADGQLLRDRDTDAYAADPALRASVLHLVGDPTGNIPALFTGEYLQELVGYDPLFGLSQGSGEGMTLTVLPAAQKAALEAMAGYRGTVAVYNYRTGEVLCAVTTPTYDPLDPPDLTGDVAGAYDGVYVNRLLQAVYTPGSIFKLVTAAAALETVPDIQERTFLCQGTMSYGVDQVVCAGTHGEIDFKTALAKSCNCAFARIAEAVGAETLTRYARLLGVVDAFSVDGVTTKEGCFDLSLDAPVNVAWAGIGQYTDLVSPYGFLRYMGVLGGGGRGAEPYFVARAGDYEAETRRTEQLLRPETAAVLADLMGNNVHTVYGDWLFPEMTVCAKSGTAEQGEGKLPHAMFAGFCRDEALPLAFVVMVENAGAGSAVAAPIAGTVLQACREALGK